MKTLLMLSLLALAAPAVAQNQPSSRAAKAKADVDSLHLDAPVRACAYIHSFIFERKDGEAPHLVKETYCTPTNQFQTRRAFHPGLYPAVLTRQAEEPAQKSDARTPKSQAPPDR